MCKVLNTKQMLEKFKEDYEWHLPTEGRLDLQTIIDRLKL